MRRVVLLLLVLLALPAGAAAQSVSIALDRPIVAVNGRASLQVVVDNAANVSGAPRFPASQGYSLTSAGQSSSFALERGSVSQSVTFQYQLVGKTVGDWEIGPVQVVVGGTKLTSNTLQLKVVKASAGGSARTAPSPTTKHYARARISNDRPYVGESLTWTLEVGSSARIRKPGIPALPDFGGLSSEPGIEPEWQTEMTIEDGRRVEVWRAALPLFAVEPGTTKVAAAKVQLPEVVGGAGMLARIREVPLSTAEVPVQVRALPPGKPSTFSGAVGRFKLRATLDVAELATGETATLTVQLDGEGALRAPEITVALPDSVRAYDEEPDVQVALVGEEVHSRAIFRKALVPLEPGRVRIPPISFSYFDPTIRKYADARSRPLTLKVTGEAVAGPAVARSEGIANTKEAVEILASDILPLRTGDRILGDGRVRITSPLVLGLLLLPLLGFGSIAGLQARRRAAGTDRGQRAARQKEAKAAAKAARTAASSGDWEGGDAALRDWLTARLERPGASISPSDAERTLSDAGAPADLAAALAALIGRLEETRYGGVPAGSLADDLADWIARADKEWRA